jgi:hypothetical protein
VLEIVQFENNRYGLRNTWTGIVIDREWRTQWGVKRALKKRTNSLSKTLRSLSKRYGKV